MQDKIGGVFDIGAHEVNYVIEDPSGNTATCSFKIKVNGNHFTTNMDKLNFIAFLISRI